LGQGIVDEINKRKDDMNSIVKIDAKEYGLEETKAREIESVFVPMITKMTELESEFNAIKTLDMCEITCKKAHALRLKYVKIRTATAEIHKKAKAFYLAGGRFVDGWKNAQLYASEGIEGDLKQIEDHYVNIEKARIEKQRQAREGALMAYDVDCSILDLGNMPDDVWSNFLAGTIATHEAKLKAEQQAEAERIAKENAAKIELEAQRKENERLKAEADAKEKALQVERAQAAKVKAEADALAKKEAEEKAAVVAEKIKLEEKIKALIECPACGHKFENK